MSTNPFTLPVLQLPKGDVSIPGLSPRPCGSCDACCNVLGVEELRKPYYVRCQHQSNPGCCIYETRPPSCREFHCLWADPEAVMLDLIPADEAYRPDRLGVLLRTNLEKVTDGEGYNLWLEVYETIPGGAGRLGEMSISLKPELTKILVSIIDRSQGRLAGVRFIRYGRYGCLAFEIDREHYPEHTKARTAYMAGRTRMMGREILVAVMV